MTLCPVSLEVDTLDVSPFPLDLTLVKAHCAIDGTDFDALLDIYMRAAISWAEGAMHRTIYARGHRWTLKGFPWGDCGEGIRLPNGKTQSITSVAYSTGGSVTTLTGPTSPTPGTGYLEDLHGDNGGVIMPPRSGGWPSTDTDVPAPVVITFDAGWAAEEVPADITHALLFAVSDAFEMRGEVDLQAGGRNYQVRETLISPYRLVRWY